MSSQNRRDKEDRREMEERREEQDGVSVSKERVIEIVNARHIHDMRHLLARHANVREAQDVRLKDVSLETMEIAFTHEGREEIRSIPFPKRLESFERIREVLIQMLGANDVRADDIRNDARDRDSARFERFDRGDFNQVPRDFDRSQAHSQAWGFQNQNSGYPMMYMGGHMDHMEHPMRMDRSMMYMGYPMMQMSFPSHFQGFQPFLGAVTISFHPFVSHHFEHSSVQQIPQRDMAHMAQRDQRDPRVQENIHQDPRAQRNPRS